MKEVYSFSPQLKIGEEGEEVIKAHFRKLGFAVRNASQTEQRNGIDFFMKKKDAGEFAVEVKTDMQAHHTGNIFVESVSVDKAGRTGWYGTARADILIYYIKFKNEFYFIPLHKLRALMRGVQTIKYRVVECKNETYSSHGMLVPISEIERHFIKLNVTNGRGSEKLVPPSSGGLPQDVEEA